MEKGKRWEIWVFAIVVLFILYIAKVRGAANAIQASPGALGGTPGMPSDTGYMNGGSQPIQTLGDLNVNVNVNPWSVLGNQYMPLFGFVGVVGGYQ